MDLEGEVLLIISIFLFTIVWSIFFFLAKKEENLKTQILDELKKGNSIVLYLKDNIERVLSGNEWTVIRKRNSYFLTNLEETFSLDEIITGKIKIYFKKGDKNDI